jgi:uncharacterized protein with GYD domain
MPKYLFKASYTAAGTKGVMQEGGSGRVAAVKQAAESVGGTLEGLYFAFGGVDVYAIGDLPDNESAAAMSMAINASESVTVETIVLLTPQELDAAAKKTVNYRSAGN